MKVRDFNTLMVGAVATFLENNLKNVDVNANDFYVNLIRAIEMKCTYEDDISNRKEIIKHKSITHAEFKEYLQSLITIKNFDYIQNTILSMLLELKIDYKTRDAINKSLGQIKTDLKDYENSTIRRLIDLINKMFISYSVNDSPTNNEWEYTELIFTKVSKANNELNDYSQEYIKALILYLNYNNG